MAAFTIFWGIATSFCGCSRHNANGPNSDVLIGKWQFKTFGESKQKGTFGSLEYMPHTLTTFENEVEFLSSGRGKLITKETYSVDGKFNYLFTNEFQTKWSTNENGECYFVITKSKGKNLRIEGEDNVKVIKEAEDDISNTNGSTDTIYFKLGNPQMLICHYSRNSEEFRMALK